MKTKSKILTACAIPVSATYGAIKRICHKLGKKKLVFIGLIIIPLLVYLINFIPNKPSKERIIYYTIPEFHTSMSGSDIGMALSKYFGSDGRIPVGHAGILVEDRNGNVYRYDYGRFPTCFGSATLPSSKGNWVKKYMGNFKGKSIDEMVKALGPKILQSFRKSGTVVHFYAMEGNPEAVVDYIEREANDPHRYRYVWYLDHTCCGRARSAFDHGRSFWLDDVISRGVDIIENYIPNGSTLAQCIFEANVTAVSGLSVEGNSPLIGTSRYTYHK